MMRMTTRLRRQGKTTCTVNTKNRAMSIPSPVQGTEVQVWKNQDEARDKPQQPLMKDAKNVQQYAEYQGKEGK